MTYTFTHDGHRTGCARRWAYEILRMSGGDAVNLLNYHTNSPVAVWLSLSYLPERGSPNTRQKRHLALFEWQYGRGKWVHQHATECDFANTKTLPASAAASLACTKSSPRTERNAATAAKANRDPNPRLGVQSKYIIIIMRMGDMKTYVGRQCRREPRRCLRAKSSRICRRYAEWLWIIAATCDTGFGTCEEESIVCSKTNAHSRWFERSLGMPDLCITINSS